MPKRSKRTLAESLAKMPSVKAEKRPMTLNEVYLELETLRARLYDITHRIASEGVTDSSTGAIVVVDDIPF